jgi:uncharacterized protein YihD (DUF1040 family)
LQAFWQTKEAHLHLLEVILKLMKAWAGFIKSPEATTYDVKQFETKKVEEAVNKFITELQAIGGQQSMQLIGEFRRIYDEHFKLPRRPSFA